MLCHGREDIVNPTELHAIPAPCSILASGFASSAAHTDTARVIGEPQTLQCISQVVTLEEVVLSTHLLGTMAWPST